MTGRPPTSAVEWAGARLGDAPPALRERILAWVQESARGSAGTTAESLSLAAQRALGRVLAGAADRSSALDLLAADGLITLALLAQAIEAPAGLDGFARALLERTVPSA